MLWCTVYMFHYHSSTFKSRKKFKYGLFHFSTATIDNTTSSTKNNMESQRYKFCRCKQGTCLS